MENVIFLNHKERQCGVYQYGCRSGKILQKSKVYNFIYIEVECEIEFINAINIHNPIGIIYNYHPATMPWLSTHNIKNRYTNIVHYMLYHEGDVNNSLNYVLFVDSTHKDTHNSFSIPRPLFANNLSFPENKIPIISSFGFGFEHKGFEKIIKLVNEQFDEAIIKLHMPFAFYADRDGHRSKSIANRCYQEMKKEKIQLNITDNFLSDEEMLNFLAASTINIFLYDNLTDGFVRGLSSVIDYALSVKVPLAISKSNMFRHISNNSPSICVEDRSISEIIKDSNTIIQPYRDLWSNANFIAKYEYLINNTKLH